MPNRMMRWFEYGHLPEHLKFVSMCCHDLAEHMDSVLPEGAEKTTGDNDAAQVAGSQGLFRAGADWK